MLDEEIETIEDEESWEDDSTIEDSEECEYAYFSLSHILEKASEEEMIMFDELECW